MLKRQCTIEQLPFKYLKGVYFQIQDSKVYQRIADLRNSGLWSETRLPMCADPTRPKLHWDYFLEEVVWMACDFKAERRLKRRVARKVADCTLLSFLFIFYTLFLTLIQLFIFDSTFENWNSFSFSFVTSSCPLPPISLLQSAQ